MWVIAYPRVRACVRASVCDVYSFRFLLSSACREWRFELLTLLIVLLDFRKKKNAVLKYLPCIQSYLRILFISYLPVFGVFFFFTFFVHSTELSETLISAYLAVWYLSVLGWRGEQQAKMEEFQLKMNRILLRGEFIGWTVSIHQELCFTT